MVEISMSRNKLAKFESFKHEPMCHPDTTDLSLYFQNVREQHFRDDHPVDHDGESRKAKVSRFQGTHRPSQK